MHILGNTLWQDFQDTQVYSWLQTVSDNKIFGVLLFMVALYVVRKFGMMLISKAIRRSIHPDRYASRKDESKREDTIISIVGATFRVLIWIFGGMLIMVSIGVDIGPLIAGASIAGVAIGFGAQSLVKDFVSGLFIIIENQYRVGDVVSISGVTGTVEEITMRQTVLRDLDGVKHHVPNGSVSVASNMTMDFAGINIELGVSYDTDLKKAEKVINQTGQKLAKKADYKDQIIEAPYFLRVQSFGASEIVLKVLGKVKPGQQWAVAGEFREMIKQAFDDNGIEIPFPQTVIHQSKK